MILIHLFENAYHSWKNKIESKRMCVEAMIEKGEVSFAEECKHLLDLHDEIV